MTDSLLATVEARRLRTLTEIVGRDQARLGQHFTPRRAAELIASLPELPHGGTLRVLDPGAGAGSLAAALTARIIRERPGLSVEITAIERDPALAVPLKETLADCQEAGEKAGVPVRVDPITGDFVDFGLRALKGDRTTGFDLVVMNPPYAKLAANARDRLAVKRALVDCPNVYAAFLALGSSALRDGGQLTAIVPRPFANGVYFDAFRKWLLSEMSLNRIHEFGSRSRVFSDTQVLQENIIVSATRNGPRSPVALTLSRDHIDSLTEVVRPYAEIVQPNDPNQFIRIDSSRVDNDLAERLSSLPSSLADLDLKVSTGRVVDFRSRGNLRDMPTGDGDVPLIYPGNFRSGGIRWPAEIRKAQAFSVRSENDRKFLLPEGVYVLVKRFSAKEERRRIVAALWDPEVNGPGPVAIENHINVFHQNLSGLDHSLAKGLALWLNATPVDQYFRTFSGHTQVNATDLRSLRYPTADQLRELGKPAAIGENPPPKIDAPRAAWVLPPLCRDLAGLSPDRRPYE